MKTIRSLFLILCFCAAQNVSATSQCLAIYVTSSFENQLQILLKNQKEKYLDVSISIGVNKIEYRTQKLLGRGGINLVYLAQSPNGQLIVVKKVSDHFYTLREHLDLGQLQEVLLTRLLNQNNILVAKIIDYDSKNGTIAKEFIDGITDETIRGHINSLNSEIQELPPIWNEPQDPEIEKQRSLLIAKKKRFEQLQADLMNKINNLKGIHTQQHNSFLDSIISFPLEEELFYREVLSNFDYKSSDFVYDISRNSWILIDP